MVSRNVVFLLCLLVCIERLHTIIALNNRFTFSRITKETTMKLDLKRMPMKNDSEPKENLKESKTRDAMRIQSLHKRIGKNSNRKTKPIDSTKMATLLPYENTGQHLMATLASGFTLGSGEYFMDVFIGTPPKHFSLILDTGSDLSWVQCVPCHDCFEQDGPFYDPTESSSYKDVSCDDPKCQLVSPPDNLPECRSETQSCPYYYWYGDSSNTTGDFALETFTVNLTSPTGVFEHKKVGNVMFGCGHWNRGLFHGAAGLLGLGRGPLSFSSQLQSLYGHSFSYCLVERNSDSNVNSKLIFGQDSDLLLHPELKFTKLVSDKESLSETYYYVEISAIVVGGEALDIPAKLWEVGENGGTIVDSGTTLSYFPDEAYKIIKASFMEKVKGLRIIENFPVLGPCYNTSGMEKMELPEFAIVFADGAVWNFPVDNYFIRFEAEEAVCLAVLGSSSGLSIIGNYQQQNFHILYDTKGARLGFAPVNCAYL